METYDVHAVVNEILKNQYFTNHGPLARALEAKLSGWFGVRNAVLVGSVELALLVSLIAMRKEGQRRLVCKSQDYSSRLMHMGALCGLEVCAIKEMKMYSEESDVFYRAIQSSGVDQFLGGSNGHTVITEVCSSWWRFSPSVGKFASYPMPLILPLPTEGGGSVLLFDSDEDAERARNVRSSYGITKPVSVFVTCNGRYSEAQAGAVLNFLNRCSRSVQTGT
ncbi:DegT/DnrJ/EryC1/StrS family aminotransferase [Marinobacter salexigens]|uniref:Aminotransferase class I/classII domain-containing protein n=1 Tax=Marinobacter salexigens TaxID=1925763 RepID=A0ABS6ADJ3_9GAMM|nr:DegT/DnrJ/EryC1/StrS family aminotransferase [Marinobacter salexigens]MBU2875710.1 hypothetical protein [Marinobacter salexigens]